MASVEKNSDDWREIRSRVDSIASAIFLIAGGALSLSITVMLGNLDSETIADSAAGIVTKAWYWLLWAILLTLALKIQLVFQAFMLQFNVSFVSRNLNLLNGIGWATGMVGFVFFCIGMILMVKGAAMAIGPTGA